MEDEGDTEQKLIQQQMEETRASLSDKLDALESQVVDTVQTATDVVQNTTEAVAETVESVKETVGNITDKVGDTMRSVAHTLDIREQVQERPWLVFGGSIGLGWLAGWYLSNRSRKRPASRAPRSFAESTPSAPSSPSPASSESAAAGWVSKQVGHLKGLAVGAVMGVVRDLVKENLPGPIGERVAEEVDNLTPHLGGEVFHGPILPESLLHPQSTPEEPQQDGGNLSASTPSTAGEKPRARSLVGERDW